ncbi:ATP-dependent helicase [Acidisoma cladoniae]|uniref:ATP-dependent helicase n=1 Tax=Acidisoma cladoniae TaxID=3040935 RepID=UPI00254D3C8B|nr:UvrD-helicase domain-containing protein [Acidisoma sp. PAMC 29798]
MADHLEGLNESQRAAVAASAPQLVLAGAGSGKTETLARRAIDLIVTRNEQPNRLLCITFTNRAASEMRARMAARLGGQAPGWVGTFHACMARLLTEDAGAVPDLPRGFAILDAARSRATLGQVAGVRDPKLLMGLHEAMSLLRNYGVEPGAKPPKGPAFARFEPSVLADASAILPTYAAELQRLRALDFDDLLILPARAMAADPALAERWSGRWSEILVDEYQDTNSAQHRLLRLLAGGHGRVFAVGDDSQSIYGWRGAEVTHLRRFAQDFPAAGPAIKLETNYRSTRTILLAANAVAAQDPDALKKTLRPADRDGEAGAAILVTESATSEDEGRAVVGWVRAYRKRNADLPLRAFAVLVRAGFVAEPILEALREAGLPVMLVSEREIEPPREVLAAIAWLRLAMSVHPAGRDGEVWDAAADDAFRRTCAMPKRAIGGAAFARLRQHATDIGEPLAASVHSAPLEPAETQEFEAVLAIARRVGKRIGLRGTKPSEALKIVADEGGLADALSAGGATRRAWATMLTRADRAGTVADFAEQAGLGLIDAEPEGPDSVQVMTLHRAKGLEFDHVFMAGLEEGVFPSRRAAEEGSLPEERRLFYVGLTRARMTLRLSWVRRRRQWASKPSRFISDIPDDLMDGAPARHEEVARAPRVRRAPVPVDKPAKTPSQAETARLVAAFYAKRRMPAGAKK